MDDSRRHPSRTVCPPQVPAPAVAHGENSQRLGHRCVYHVRHVACLSFSHVNRDRRKEGSREPYQNGNGSSTPGVIRRPPAGGCDGPGQGSPGPLRRPVGSAGGPEGSPGRSAGSPGGSTGPSVRIATIRATATGMRRATTDATIGAMVRDGWAETTASIEARTTAITADATMAPPA